MPWVRIPLPAPKDIVMSAVNDKMIELAKHGVFLDIGANRGFYLDAMSAKASYVIAFEPHPENIEYIENNFKHLHNLDIAAIALSDVEGEINLYQCDRHHAQHTISTMVASIPIWGHSIDNYITVPSRTLDMYCERNYVSNITGIKIDVEGAEEQVFRGAIKTLTYNNPVIALETHNPINADALDEIVHSLGYSFWDVNGIKCERIEGDKQYIMYKE